MADNQSSNILSIITEDHQAILNLMSEIGNDSEFESMYETFNELYKKLSLFSEAKQIVFYPALREFEDMESYIENAETELEEIAVLLEQVKQNKPGSNEFMSKLTELRAEVEDHCETEENEIFPTVQEKLDEQTLTSLAQEFEQAKSKLEADVTQAMAQ